MTVPIATSRGRSGLGPQLALSLRLGLRQRPVRLRLDARLPVDQPARPTRGCRATTTPRSPTSSCSPAPRIWCRCSDADGDRRRGPRRGAGLRRSTATGRGSRVRSPASSAGPAGATATCTGARYSTDNVLTVYGGGRARPDRRPRGPEPDLPLADLRDPRRQGQRHPLRLQARGRRGRRPGRGARAQPRTAGDDPRRAGPTAISKRIRYGNRRPLLDRDRRGDRASSPTRRSATPAGCSRSSSTTASTTRPRRRSGRGPAPWTCRPTPSRPTGPVSRCARPAAAGAC